MSEADGAFFADSSLSNEDAYLDAVPWFEQRADDAGVYIGVGPEQNLSFIAALRPKLAFVIDIRRDNLLLHLLFREMFIEADNAGQWLALLLGRSTPPGFGLPAPCSELAAIRRLRKDPEVHHALVTHTLSMMQREAVPLRPADESRLGSILQEFFERDLRARFHSVNSRHTFATLQELLCNDEPDEKRQSFLASSELFGFLTRFEREARLIPVTGDFAGQHTFATLAQELEQQQLRVSALYASNVEEYLLLDGKWQAWRANVAALPLTAEALLVRSAMLVPTNTRLTTRARLWRMTREPVADTLARPTPRRFEELLGPSAARP
ncbi:MAG TPA: hypothetical protein VHM70_15400 [Polyangiaceae bacterium]|nr:hypothetical protein [Polyangiaceae bacterium]